MVGFNCRWQSGDIKIDETELEHADWFDAHALPELPPPLSLSGRSSTAGSPLVRKSSGLC
jgi:NAD+ diphosphatase